MHRVCVLLLAILEGVSINICSLFLAQLFSTTSHIEGVELYEGDPQDHKNVLT